MIDVCGINVQKVVGGPFVKLPTDARYWIGTNKSFEETEGPIENAVQSFCNQVYAMQDREAK